MRYNITSKENLMGGDPIKSNMLKSASQRDLQVPYSESFFISFVGFPLEPSQVHPYDCQFKDTLHLDYKKEEKVYNKF